MSTQALRRYAGRSPRSAPTFLALLLTAAFLCATSCSGDSGPPAGRVDDTPADQFPIERPAIPPSQTQTETALSADEVSCPTGDFVFGYTAPAWVQSLTDVCSSQDGLSILVKNVSPLVLLVRNGDSSILRPAVFGPTRDFTAQVSAMVARQLATTGSTALPPGAYIIADGQNGQPGQLYLEQPNSTTFAGYGARVLAAWLQSRTTHRSQTLAERVVKCGGEISELLQSSQGNDRLDYLMADAVLGAGGTCGPLVRDVLATDGDAPPVRTRLRDEFAKAAREFKATIVDDLIQTVRHVVRLAATR